jgi:aerobic carbon-monoxide dehydrogenase medium subunit
VLVALGAQLRLRSQRGERTIAASETFVGPFFTALEPGELITEIEVPSPSDDAGSAYVAVEHPASGFALAGAAALVTRDSATVALTGIAATPLLLGADDDLATVEVFGDRFAPEEYRRQLAATVVRRALAQARARMGGST